MRHLALIVSRSEVNSGATDEGGAGVAAVGPAHVDLDNSIPTLEIGRLGAVGNNDAIQSLFVFQNTY